jgi:splicing factor 3B subunit 3
LNPDSTLENKSVQALTSAPSALQIMAMADSSSGGTTLYLHIGLYSGVYLRTVLDEVTGELSDTRTRFIGAKPVKLSQVSVKGQTAVLALSTRPWLGYSDVQTKSFMLTPLDYVGLEWGWNFSSEQCVEGMIGIQGRSLRYVIYPIFKFPQTTPRSYDEKINPNFYVDETIKISNCSC